MSSSSSPTSRSCSSAAERVITLLAIYGALLSTAVAAVQFWGFYSSRRFVHVQVRRSFDLEDEHVEFLISNRSNLNTRIREIMVGIYGVGGQAGFHMLWGSGLKAFKLSFDDAGDEIELPAILCPGDVVVCRYSSADAKRDIEYFSKKPFSWNKDDKLSNLFYLEVEHSRANTPIEVLFEMDVPHLNNLVAPWKRLTGARQRWRFWPVDRAQK